MSNWLQPLGKTTLARQLASAVEGPVTHFDLESSRDLGRLQDPLFALEGLKGLVILDEIQLRPELFPTLRVLVDRDDVPTVFWSWAAPPRSFCGKAPSR